MDKKNKFPKKGKGDSDFFFDELKGDSSKSAREKNLKEKNIRTGRILPDDRQKQPSDKIQILDSSGEERILEKEEDVDFDKTRILFDPELAAQARKETSPAKKSDTDTQWVDDLLSDIVMEDGDDEEEPDESNLIMTEVSSHESTLDEQVIGPLDTIIAADEDVVDSFEEELNDDMIEEIKEVIVEPERENQIEQHFQPKQPPVKIENAVQSEDHSQNETTYSHSQTPVLTKIEVPITELKSGIKKLEGQLAQMQLDFNELMNNQTRILKKLMELDDKIEATIDTSKSWWKRKTGKE